MVWLALWALGGCIEWEQTVEIAADGSGTQFLRVRMSMSAEDMVARLASVDPTNPFDPLASSDREQVVRELDGTGLALLDHSAAPKGKRGFDLRLGFDDAAELRRSPLLGSRAEWRFEAGPREGMARVVLFPQGEVAWREARAKVQQMLDDPSSLDQDRVRGWFEGKKAEMEGLDVTLRLRLPGRVLGCTNNLSRDPDDPNAVVVEIRAEQITKPEDLLRWLAPRFLVDFDARGMRFPLDPPR